MDDIALSAGKIILDGLTVVCVMGMIIIMMHIMDYLLDWIELVIEKVVDLISLIKRSFGRRK